MRERPILFNTEMVQAVLEGRKTQTRRVVKGWKSYSGKGAFDVSRFGGLEAGCYCGSAITSGFVLRSRGRNLTWNDRTKPLHCPYGNPGDQLWVRETWQLFDVSGFDWPKGNEIPKERPEGWHVIYYQDAPTDVQDAFSFRPSIHMPRWASRIQLEITDVRVEKVQDITRGEAMQEGCPFPNMSIGKNPSDWFSELWNSINETRGFGWDVNPWVWVVEFKIAGGAV